VKSEPKIFASLSSGLLARKGAARPAMRPQGFGQGGGALEDQPLRNPVAALTPVQSPVHNQQAQIAGRLSANEAYSEQDLSEEGEELDETAELYDPEDDIEVPPAIAERVVVQPVTAPARAPAACRAPRPRAAPGSKGRAAFTLRLDPERHLKLRLACAVGGRSAQMLVTDALDALLSSMPELDAMASKANRKG